jgi:lipopolysaccharide/colanic/teichoic acid biosynthesis glycosyltransferase
MRNREAYFFVKRSLDAVAAAIGLVLLSPLLVAISLVVKLGSPGPVFFRQERMGRGGVPFSLIKFRTMRTGRGGPEVTVAGDARVTAGGRLLRTAKLDELPQLVNVLRGDMSLVGPRPEVRCYVEQFAFDYERVLSIRPGITDFAAIEYRDEESILAASANPERAYVDIVLPAKIRLYDEYIRRMSLTTDFSILLRTFLAILR